MATAGVHHPRPIFDTGFGRSSSKPVPAPFKSKNGSNYDFIWKELYGIMPPPQRRPKQVRKENELEERLKYCAQFKDFCSTQFIPKRLVQYHDGGCTCLPLCRTQFLDAMYEDYPVYNILSIPDQSHDLISRYFKTFSVAVRRKVSVTDKDVSEDVASSPRVQFAALKESALSQMYQCLPLMNYNVRDSLGLSRVSGIVQGMKAYLSSKLIRLAGWSLHHILGKLLSSITVHTGQMDMVLRANASGIPVIYLPTHRSHLDYILVTFTLFNYGLAPPYVAAGDNLQIPIFGRLLQGLGGFFIRRKLDNGRGRDYVYRAVLQTYVEEILRDGRNLEFFIEGGRSRTGKAVYPKSGLLSVLIDSMSAGILTDALLVPINISYEHILDGTFMNELMGIEKEKETFFSALKGLYKVFCGQYGHTRIDFCQPFSLREYMDIYFEAPRALLPGQYAGVLSLGLDDGQELDKDDSQVYSNEGGGEQGEENVRSAVQALAEHVVYRFTSVQTVMAPQMLAFILRCVVSEHGFSLAKLKKWWDVLTILLTEEGKVLGFCGSVHDIIQHAFDVLQHNHLAIAISDTGRKATNCTLVDTDIIQPNTQLPWVLGLDYYANGLTPTFALQSVIANALYSLVPIDHLLPNNSGDAVINGDHLLRRSMELCHLLKFEFIFCPPCKQLNMLICDRITQLFVQSDILGFVEEDNEDMHRARRMARVLAVDSDDDYDCLFESSEETPVMYTFNPWTSNGRTKYEMYRRVLGPILECYVITAKNLTVLLDAPVTVLEFTNIVHDDLKKRVANGMAEYNSSASVETIKTALRSFQETQNVLEQYVEQDGNVAMLRLTPRCSSLAALEKFVADIYTFLI